MVTIIVIGMLIAGAIHTYIVRQREIKEEMEENMRLLRKTYAHFGRPFDPPAPKLTHWTERYQPNLHVGRPLAFA